VPTVIETVDLPLTYDGADVLREVNRHRHVGVLGLEVGDELCVGVGALPWPLQHQPGRAARG
jgi:hypothetical protein